MLPQSTRLDGRSRAPCRPADWASRSEKDGRTRRKDCVTSDAHADETVWKRLEVVPRVVEGEFREPAAVDTHYLVAGTENQPRHHVACRPQS